MKSFKQICTGKKLEELSGKRNEGFTGIDEVGKFWVVTEADKNSTLPDILFEADIFDIHLQLKGGLKGSEIVGIFKKKSKASKAAEAQMAKHWDGF
jgi:hypothetical protein